MITVTEKKIDVKHWWARVTAKPCEDYGRVVPTGCTEFLDAVFYIETYPGERYVQEWLFQ